MRIATGTDACVRLTRLEEIDEVMGIYARAREFMAAHGNPNQWGPTCWPPRELIIRDVACNKSYVYECGRQIAAVFYYDFGKDVVPTYDEIEEGSWASDLPYGVVHRIASAGITRGAGEAYLRWAFEKSGHLRIDTHADNRVMRSLLERMGFEKRGIIHVLEDDYPRIAYERLRPDLNLCVKS